MMNEDEPWMFFFLLLFLSLFVVGVVYPLFPEGYGKGFWYRDRIFGGYLFFVFFRGLMGHRCSCELKGRVKNSF